MTPDEARALLDGTTPGPWRVDPRHAGEVLSPENHWLAGAYETEDQFTPDELARAQSDTRLIAAAPTLAALAAGMHEEWGITYTGVNHGGRHTEWGYETRDEAERQARRYRLCTDMHPVHVVRRYVTTPEEA